MTDPAGGRVERQVQNRLSAICRGASPAFLVNVLTNDPRQDTCIFTINFVLCILAIILSGRLARWTTHKVAIDLARVQYLYFMQPSTGVLPVVEDMVD
jgi:hypothetical protein